MKIRERGKKAVNKKRKEKQSQDRDLRQGEGKKNSPSDLSTEERGRDEE